MWALSQAGSDVGWGRLAHIAEIVGWLTAIILFLYLGGRVLKTLWQFGRAVNRVTDWVEDIYKEFRPNDGHSLNDAIRRIDHNVNVNARNIATLYRAAMASGPWDDEGIIGPLEPLKEPPNEDG